MEEYISRKEMLENLKKFAPEHITPLIEQLVMKQPTADVEEVKHGEWIKIVRDIGKDRSLTHYKCSLCGVYISDKANYCYHCGAKMNGGNDV